MTKNYYDFGVGFHSSVALSTDGRGWLAYRDWPGAAVEVWAWVDPATPTKLHNFPVPHSPAFPRLHALGHTIWLAYHDGMVGHLLNLSSAHHFELAPCDNNDPICFGDRWVAWQGAAADGWPISRMDLQNGETVQAGMGQGTGLSRVTSDGQVITMDADRFSHPGGLCPSFAAGIVVAEHGDSGVVWQLSSGEQGRLWPTEPRFLPSVAADGDRVAITAWGPGAPVKVWVGTRTDLIGEEPVAELDTIRAIRERYPTPLGERHAALLLECARALNMGLLRKTGGTRIALPPPHTEDGHPIEVSQDILMDPISGRIFDFLGDAEGAATPGWGEAGGSPQPLSRIYVPVEDGDDDDDDDDDQDPDGELAQQIAELRARVEALEKAKYQIVVTRVTP